jgi:hypothetical protein
MTIFDEKQHPRAVSGTFTDKPQSNPEVWLEKKPSAAVLNTIDYAEGMRSADSRIARAAVAELFAQTSTAVTDSGRRRGLSAADIEDATSEALLSLNDYVRKGSSVGRGLIQIRAVTVTSQFVDGPLRHESKKGIKVLSERVDSRESKIGRLLTDREIDTMAEAVRESWPDARHRPVAAFHREAEQRTGIPAEHADLVEMENRGQVVPGVEDSPRSWLRASLEEALDQTKGSGQQYEKYARGANLPLPIPRTIQPREADAIVGDYMGEITQLADGFIYGENTDRENQALFAPFGELSYSERSDIAEAFAAQPDYADRLWVSAVVAATGATKRVSTKRQPH